MASPWTHLKALFFGVVDATTFGLAVALIVFGTTTYADLDVGRSALVALAAGGVAMVPATVYGYVRFRRDEQVFAGTRRAVRFWTWLPWWV